MSFRYDESPIALPYLLDGSVEIRASYVLKIALFLVVSCLQSFLRHVFIIRLDVIGREIVEIDLFFEAIGRVPERREMVDFLDDLERLTFVAVMHNDYKIIITPIYQRVVTSRSLLSRRAPTTPNIIW